MSRMMRLFVVFAFALMWMQSAVGQVLVYGDVFEQDGYTPIENALVTFSGIDINGDTIVCQFVADSVGHFSDSLSAGAYWVWASAEGYESSCLSDTLEVGEDQLFVALEFLLNEIYYPVRYVSARQYVNDLVRVSWSMRDPLLVEDFETGDLSRFPWNNNLGDYPWAIDTLHAYEGHCCMKSSCEGVGRDTSRIEVSVYVPLEGKMGFYSKISSENPWDKGQFYLDDIKNGMFGGRGLG